MTQFNDIQKLKRNFFAMRNGIIADTMRKAGAPYKIIFGLNLPQIADIAAITGKNAEMARRLWANTSTRESMLIAPMLFPPEEMTADEAIQWIATSTSAEATDILCHRLLRKMSWAYDLACRLAATQEPMHRYAAMRLLWPFVSSQHQAEVLTLAEAEAAKNHQLTSAPARQIIEEIKYLRES